jgi:hypothetical protein
MIDFEVLLVAIIVPSRGGHCTYTTCNVPAKDAGVFDIPETFHERQRIGASTASAL